MRAVDEVAVGTDLGQDLERRDARIDLAGGASQIDAEIDVLVVGGGPAGTLAALGLARLGHRTVLCERGPHRRPKCCGQCLNPRVAGILDRFGLLGAVDELAVGRTDRFEWRVESRGECGGRPPDPDTPSLPPRRIALEATRPGWIVRREDLDDRLWRAAVATGAHPARGVAAHVGPWRDGRREVRLVDALGMSRRVRAKLVVGADGLGSGVARATGLAEGASAGRKFGFSGAWPASDSSLGTERAGALAAGLAAELEEGCIHMRSFDGGYLGLVREEDGTVHVAGLVGSHAARRRPQEFLADALGLAAAPRLERATACGPLPWSPRRIAGPGVVLVGDAAGYVEPFTGEGMAWAIEGAAALVEAIADLGPSAAGLAEYARRRRSIIARQRTCRRLAALLDRPRLVAATWRLAGRLGLAEAAVAIWGRRVAAELVRA